MSGIYIGGMELPEGTDCLDIKIYRNGDIYVRNTGYGGWRATPVPDHGDLIDKDETMNAILEEPSQDFSTFFASMVNEMPAIIPSDKE